MVGIVVVTHGSSGAAMVAAIERMLGPEAVVGFASIEVKHCEPKEAVLARVREASRSVDTGAGVVVACDLFGSTPGNCAVQVMRGELDEQRAVVFGVNLPMLVKLATARGTGLPPDELAHVAAETAIRSIREANRQEGAGHGK